MAIQNVKGTHDIVGVDANDFSYVENLLQSIAELFAYEEARIPIMEYTEVFQRGVGNGSDIVRKEMYTFKDKADRSITLRPEFTAGIVRMAVQNKLFFTHELPYKCYYFGPAFRYERPQLGRYRQFHQFGVESFGNISAANVVEVISMAYIMLQTLNLENVKIRINTLGDEESRNNYREALKGYFALHLDEMCDDCKERFKLNPLRILDCKVPEDQEIIKDAPLMNRYLNDASISYFNEVLTLLEELEIPYEVDPTLVRGLDYYSGVVFEFEYKSQKGHDYGAIGGGGAYLKLVKELGGPDLPGIGFSFGLERLVSVLKDDELLPDNVQKLDFYVAPLGEKMKAHGLAISNLLRLNGFTVDMCFDDVKVANMIKRADRKNARFMVIIGEEEAEKNIVIIKDLHQKVQYEVASDKLETEAIRLFNEECECANCQEQKELEDR